MTDTLWNYSTNGQNLTQWITGEEAAERQYLGNFNSDDLSSPWLFGLSFNDMKNANWKNLIQRIQKERSDKPLGDLLSSFANKA